MKLKLMISALMLCSSLAFAGDLSTAPAPTTAPKKAMKGKVFEPVADSKVQHPDDSTALGGGLGTLGTGTAAAKPSKKLVRGSAPEGK